MITIIAVPTFDRDGLLTNKPMALTKTRQLFGLKPIIIADSYPLTDVNGNELLLMAIFPNLF